MNFLTATFLIAMLGFSTANLFGACEQHFPDGSIGVCPDGDCSDFIDPGDGTTCVDCGIAYYPTNTAYILYNKKTGEAWIETGKKPIPRIMSDKYLAFQKVMLEKYGKRKRTKAEGETIKKEFALFFKTDDHKVSPDRLERSCKNLNLKVKYV